MTLYTPSPPSRPFSADKANVLTSWWITLLCGVIIVLRLVGRFVRVEKLFKEDWVAAAALIPLFVRMAFVHPILVFGTNNVFLEGFTGLVMGEGERRRREMGSRLVLVARVLHPLVLWLLKVVTLEFFDRLVGFSGRNRYTTLLRFMRISLGATFLAIIIANLAECRPFPHYFQVSPDPGGQCRQGYAHLLTVTAGNAFTDLLLVVFPVPIVLKSRLSKGRKFMLVLLFCLHLFTVVVAIYKVPAILKEDGYQGTRTMWASAEILMATFAANALTIGTFVRDTGVKKKKFKYKPNDSEPRSVITRGESRGVTGKKGSWDDEAESDGEGEEGGRRGTKEVGITIHRDGSPPHSREASDSKGSVATSERETAVLPRTESLDSLIPRGRFMTASPDGVVKTTTIEVTVSSAQESGGLNARAAAGGLMLRPADGVVTASARGRGRGTTVVLHEMDSLPDTNGLRQGGARSEV